MSDTATLLSPPPLPQPPRATPSLGRAFGGVWRLTVRRNFSPGKMAAFGVSVAVLTLLTLTSQRHGNAGHYFEWVILLFYTLLVPVLSFVFGAGMVRDDMAPSTVDYVFTRPVSRISFLAFRYLSQTACALVFSALACCALIAVGLFYDVPELAAAVPVMLLAQAMEVAVFTAFGFFCATLTARYLIIGIFYAGVVELGVGHIPTQVNRLSLLHHIRAMFEEIAPGSQNFPPVPESPFAAAMVLLTVSAVMIAISAILFNRREMAGEKQKEI